MMHVDDVMCLYASGYIVRLMLPCLRTIKWSGTTAAAVVMCVVVQGQSQDDDEDEAKMMHDDDV